MFFMSKSEDKTFFNLNYLLGAYLDGDYAIDVSMISTGAQDGSSFSLNYETDSARDADFKRLLEAVEALPALRNVA
jgi:hypothetical protein